MPRPLRSPVRDAFVAILLLLLATSLVRPGEPGALLITVGAGAVLALALAVSLYARLRGARDHGYRAPPG